MSLRTLQHRAMILFDHQGISQLDSDMILKRGSVWVERFFHRGQRRLNWRKHRFLQPLLTRIGKRGCKRPFYLTGMSRPVTTAEKMVRNCSNGRLSLYGARWIQARWEVYPG